MVHLRICITLLLILSALTVPAQRKAVFIILDGIPADVIEKVETPVLREIAKQGGYSRAYVGGEKGGYSQSPTISAVGYNHLLTGTWTHKHNVWDNDIKAPNYSYWNIFRMAKTVKPQLTTAVFSSWTDNRTKLVGESLPEAGNIKLDYSYDGLELDKTRFPHTNDRTFMFNIDEAVSTEAGRYILDKGPDLSWVYLEFTDDMGHMHGDSPQFYDAVKKADAQVGRVWKAIKAREAKFGEEWMIVITTDHGRDVETGKGHGGQSDRERTTWITTNARDLNAHFKETPAVVDIAPSVLRFLKVEVPEEKLREMDGVPFVGGVSLSHLKATRTGNQVALQWNILNPTGEATVYVSRTNTFSTGQSDHYDAMGKVNVSAGKFTFTLPAESDFYKVVIVAPYNTMNAWLVRGDLKPKP